MPSEDLSRRMDPLMLAHAENEYRDRTQSEVDAFAEASVDARLAELDESDAELDAATDPASKPTYLDAQIRYAKAAAPVYRPRRMYQQATRRVVCDNAHPALATTFDVAKATAFATANTDLLTFINGFPTDEFYVSCAKRFMQTGEMTPNQVAAIRKQMVRAAERTATPAAATASASGLNLRALPSGKYAVPGGDTRLKVQIDNVVEGKWANWVFVKDAAEYGQGKRYGAQRPGEMYQGDIEAELRAIAADPEAASAAYGRLVGCCGVCGRKLEDEKSVARGIGPVCAAKNGW